MMECVEIKKEDSRYPEKLRKIDNPPSKLYAIGNINLLNELSISVVGTRHITDYGKRYGKAFCREFAIRDIPIVSGMAVGTDALAHKTALEYGGKTIAVLPCGFDNIFPKQNQGLFKQIIDNNGLVVTEYEEQVKADSDKFLERNRIVAGLGICLFVIEALYRSGTSVTAKNAKEQGKYVFALPGSLDNIASVGTNNLIKKGAKLVTEPVDILENYPEFLSRKIKNSQEKMIKEEYKKIYEMLLFDNFLMADEIINKTGIPTRTVITNLTLMELDGIIEQKTGKGYRKKV